MDTGTCSFEMEVGTGSATVFTNANGVYQDGVVAHARDGAGILWAIVGHENLGGISVWAGSELATMELRYRPTFRFQTGQAGDAFHGTPYPDGPRSRGLLWPCGLYIDLDNSFHLFVHNETGWGAGTMNYTALEIGVEGEPDFRHIAKLTSADQGRSWEFDGWIITSAAPSWTDRAQPEEGIGPGQSGEIVCLGAGDLSLFANTRDGFLYLFYTEMLYDLSDRSISDTIHVARAAMESCGCPGSWRKLFEGVFNSEGNGGPSTEVARSGCVPSVSYNTELDTYVMTTYNRDAWVTGKGTLQVSLSEDLRSWSSPQLVAFDRESLSLPYFTQCSLGREPGETGERFALLGESNGTDVVSFPVVVRRVR